MAMSMKESGGRISEVNVTPMIDILLVLLIIFMIIAPVTPKGLQALVPQPPRDLSKSTPDSPIVVQVFAHSDGSPTYKINDIGVGHDQLLAKLTDIYANRAERVLFVRGDDNVSFQYVAEVMDIAKAANVDHVGLMTAKVQQSQ